MGAKRQRLARKRYREAHPELFPKTEPPQPKDPSKKENKNNPKSELNYPKRPNFKKHPLRVRGMKPGDSCFICRGQDHIFKHCPLKKICFNCGETGHSVDKCPQPLQDGGTKFASCFICNERGHLSKNCPQNTHRICAKGGYCKICWGVTDLIKRLSQ